VENKDGQGTTVCNKIDDVDRKVSNELIIKMTDT
jgi:hypothetical protein